VPELRHAIVPFRGLEFRDATATGDGSHTIKGHAAVFDEETVLYDIGWLRVREVIAPGAFANVLARKPLVHLNHGHDMNTAIAQHRGAKASAASSSARTSAARVFARVTPEDPDVQKLAVKMRYGYTNQMSFAFTVARAERLTEEDEDGNEDVLRTIQEIGELYDVCVCAQGAYPQTAAELATRSRASLPPITINLPGLAGADGVAIARELSRSLSEEIGRAVQAGQPTHRTEPVGAPPVAPEERGDVDPEPAPPAAEPPVVEPEAGAETTERAKRAAARMRIRAAMND
jgi:HK97 family phage prohead protease